MGIFRSFVKTYGTGARPNRVQTNLENQGNPGKVVVFRVFQGNSGKDFEKSESGKTQETFCLSTISFFSVACHFTCISCFGSSIY